MGTGSTPAVGRARRRTLALAAAVALLAPACEPGEDAAEQPAPGDTDEPGPGEPEGDPDEAMELVASAAASTLNWGLAQATVTVADDGDEAFTAEVTDDFDADRRELRHAGSSELVLVDADEVLVRSDAIAGAAWARMDLTTMAGEATAATQDFLLLPLTDSAEVLRRLAEAQGAARPAGDGRGYEVVLDVDLERDLALGEDYGWLARYVDTGYDEVTMLVELEGDGTEQAVRSVAYPLPTPADRGVRQESGGGATPGFDDEATGELDDAQEGLAGTAGLQATIAYVPGDESPAERPDDGDVRDAGTDELAELLTWAPVAGRFR